MLLLLLLLCVRNIVEEYTRDINLREQHISLAWPFLIRRTYLVCLWTKEGGSGGRRGKERNVKIGSVVCRGEKR